MITARVAEQWNLELDDLFVNIGHRFGRVELRRRMRDTASSGRRSTS
ncbi:hypothetical protein ACGFNX_15760 [Streptomyces sp. NPDC048723]